MSRDLLLARFDRPGASLAVTSREGGVSRGGYASLNIGLHVGDDPAAVIENRRRAAAALGRGLDDLVFAEQVHGAGVALVRSADRGRGARTIEEAFAGADALVTGEPGPVLVGLGADCPVVGLFDAGAPALGVAHAGWRGVAAGVIEATIVAMMEAHGARPERMLAIVSPSIGPCCYEVGTEVIEAIGTGHARTGHARPGTRGRPHLDLRAAVEARLRAAGVKGSIEGEPLCTACAPDRLFSHRGARGRPTGRHAVMGALRS